MLRKQAAAKRVHRVRWYFRAWLDTSMVRSTPARVSGVGQVALEVQGLQGE